MSLKRRSFIRLTAGSAAAGTALFHGLSSFTKRGLEDLRPMTDDVVPITLEERLSRIQKAQRLHKLMIIGTDLRVWEEHESPYRQIALALKDRGIRSGNEIEVNFGQASAFPHGSIQPQHLKKGNIVLVDGGCKVQGYASDISRTIVFGAAPTRRQREVWDIGKKAQAAGFAAARL